MRVFNKDPQIWSIPYKEVMESDVLDCKFFNIQRMEIIEHLNRLKCPIYKLKDLAKIFIGKTPERYEYADYGIPIIKVINITNRGLRWDNISFIPHEVIKKWGRKKTLKIKPLDILIPSAAHSPEAIGEKADIVSFIPNNFKQVLCTAEVEVIRPDIESINPYYLLAYLRSWHARIQIKSVIRGQTAHLYPFDLAKIIIPIFSTDIQEKIGNQIKQAEDLRRKSYEKRKNLELKYTQPYRVKLGDDFIHFTVKRTEIGERLDVEYYHFPRLIPEILSKGPYSVYLLSDIATISRKTINPKRYPKKVFNYVEISNIDEAEGDITHFSQFYGIHAPQRARRLLRAGDIVISSVRTYRGAIAIIPPELDKSIGSTGFIVIKPNTELINAETLWLMLRSDVCILQMSRLLAGGLYPAIVGNEILKIKVPVPPKDAQKKIAIEVSKILEWNAKSRKLNMKATQKVEHIIEGKEPSLI
ncbi:MAG: hypothetical protein DRJ38_03355 [Thermoprotei archaeon]|nr:MAG: hypothetical protein DRJ38_03355 [Thermoprotei archaeon]